MKKLKTFNAFSNINEMEQEKVVITNDGSMESYYNTLNPDTGFRYEIPMLRFMDSDYKMKYIEYMKLKETNPAEFERVLQWN